MTTIIDAGSLVDLDGRPAVRFERRFDAPVERVWRAVTDPDELRAWFPARVDGERRLGATLSFTFDGGEPPPDTGPVTEWDPPRAWAFEWGGSTIRIALEPDGDGTRLVFTDRPYDPSMTALTGAGWHACLAELDARVAGRPSPGEEVWRDVHDAYLDLMGPPLASRRDQVALTYERWHHVDPARLWSCLTDPAEVSAWMGFPAEIELRRGGRWSVDFAPAGDPLDGVVVALDPGRRVAHSFADVSIVEWEVEPAEHGCRYRLTHHGVSLDHPMAVAVAAGWHAFLVQLDMYAASGQHVATASDRWQEPYRRLLARDAGRPAPRGRPSGHDVGRTA